MKKVNRRKFLKGMGVAAAGAIAAGHLPTLSASLLPPSDKKETYNVVVIGSGLAGLAAALEARQAGANVIILEKAPDGKDGGDSKLALGGIIVPPSRTKEGSQIYFEDFMKKSSNRGNAELSRVLSENVWDGIDWLKSQGVELFDPEPAPPYRVKIVQVKPVPLWACRPPWAS